MSLADDLIVLLTISVVAFTVFLVWIVVLLNSIRWFLAQDLAIKMFLKNEYLKDLERGRDVKTSIDPVYAGKPGVRSGNSESSVYGNGATS